MKHLSLAASPVLFLPGLAARLETPMGTCEDCGTQCSIIIAALKAIL